MRRTRGRGGNGQGSQGNYNGGGGGGNYSGGGSRRPSGGAPSRHQVYDSNGPEVRIRGNAMQVYEKYLNLARDAQASGDRVKAESLLQHSEHYYRIVLSIQEATGEIYQQRSAQEGEQAEIQQDGTMMEDPSQMPQPSTQATTTTVDMTQQPQPEAAVA